MAIRYYCARRRFKAVPHNWLWMKVQKGNSAFRRTSLNQSKKNRTFIHNAPISIQVKDALASMRRCVGRIFASLRVTSKLAYFWHVRWFVNPNRMADGNVGEIFQWIS